MAVQNQRRDFLFGGFEDPFVENRFGDSDDPPVGKLFGESDDYTVGQHGTQPSIQHSRMHQSAGPSVTDRYAYLRRLANSSEGTVGLVQNLSTLQTRVAKIIKRRSTGPVREAHALQLAGPHRNLIEMFEVEYNPTGEAIMVLEYCRGGDLHSQIHHFAAKGTQAPEAVVLHPMTQIADALAFIHGGWIRGQASISYRVTDTPHTNLVHGDIKPENIFIRPLFGFGLPDFVLGDFGQAFQKDVEIRTGGGTNGYRAPEYYSSQKPPITAKADVYSYGITMLHLCQGHKVPLFGCGQSPEQVWVPQNLYGHGIEAFLRGCLQPEPNDRLEMAPQGALMYTSAFRNRVDAMPTGVSYEFEMRISR